MNCVLWRRQDRACRPVIVVHECFVRVVQKCARDALWCVVGTRAAKARKRWFSVTQNVLVLDRCWNSSLRLPLKFNGTAHMNLTDGNAFAVESHDRA
jgi:hypothetical protein